MTRSRHCCSALRPRQPVEAEPDDAVGELLRRLRARPRPRTAARPSVIAPSRSLRRPRRLARRGVEADVLAAFDLAGEALLDLAERDRGGEQDAALRGGAGQFRHGEERLARQRRGRIDVGAAAVGQQERAVAAAALGDAIGIGQRQNRAGRQARTLSPMRRRPPPSASPSAARPRRGASGRGGTDRAGGRDRRRCRRARAPTGSRRYRRRAGPRPRAAASTTMRASRGGSGSWRSLRPSSVMRRSRIDGAELGQQRPRLGQRARRRRIEERKLARIGRAPLRQIEQHARQIGGEDFRPRIRLRATRSAARPTAGSRCRARCGRRGRAADRRRRARPARFRAASGRRPARSAAPAPARNRPRCARPRW